MQPPHGHGEGALDIWAGVDRLVDRSPTLADLRSHRLELFAARRWRARGIPVPEELVAQERRAAVVTLAAPVLLERVTGAVGTEIVLLKGPEIARRYPDPTLRAFGDVDLLVADAAAAQNALLAAGFEEIGDPALYVDIHHLRPLRWPELPVVVEIHSRPKWIDVATGAPSTAELLDAAQPTAGGWSVLPAAHHALLLAAHSWAHEPLRRLRDLVDVAVMADAADPAELAELARAWRLERLWRVTMTAAEAVLLGKENAPWALRIWAQNLAKARERTVLENHLQRWLSDFSVMSAAAASARLPATISSELRPEGDEGWRNKLSRSVQAVRNATRRRSAHEDELFRRRGGPPPGPPGD